MKIRKVWTSYFYQVRFFSKNMLPLSTACSDPLWYHRNTKNNKYTFYDKNGVLNGLRCEKMHPNDSCSGLCRGRKNCDSSPDNCLFLLKYSKQLDDIDFVPFIKEVERALEETGCNTPVFLVHEAAWESCSERDKIQEWFRKNGIECEEWVNHPT